MQHSTPRPISAHQNTSFWLVSAAPVHTAVSEFPPACRTGEWRPCHSALERRPSRHAARTRLLPSGSPRRRWVPAGAEARSGSPPDNSPRRSDEHPAERSLQTSGRPSRRPQILITRGVRLRSPLWLCGVGFRLAVPVADKLTRRPSEVDTIDSTVRTESVRATCCYPKEANSTIL